MSVLTTKITYTSNNFYIGQYGAFGIIKKKLKKIWAVIRNKDYCYSEIYLTEENLKEFKEYLNKF